MPRFNPVVKNGLFQVSFGKPSVGGSVSRKYRAVDKAEAKFKMMKWLTAGEPNRTNLYLGNLLNVLKVKTIEPTQRRKS